MAQYLQVIYNSRSLTIFALEHSEPYTPRGPEVEGFIQVCKAKVDSCGLCVSWKAIQTTLKHAHST